MCMQAVYDIHVKLILLKDFTVLPAWRNCPVQTCHNFKSGYSQGYENRLCVPFQDAYDVHENLLFLRAQTLASFSLRQFPMQE